MVLICRLDMFPDHFTLATRTFKIAAEKGNEKESTHGRHRVEGVKLRWRKFAHGRVRDLSAFDTRLVAV